MAESEMRLTNEQIERYWAAIAADSQLGGRQTCYVETDVKGQEPVKVLPAGEVAEDFDRFRGIDFGLELRVRSVVQQQREEQQQEEQEKQEKVEYYGVLEGILKYAGQHDRGAHVLLVGKPGSGKTTALERLLAGQELIEGRLPVLVRLRDLSPLEPEPVLAEVERVLGCRGLALSRDEVVAVLREQVLLLLDGVNEIPMGEGTGLPRSVQRFRERFVAVPMVFTTRVLDLGVDLGIGKKLEMEPLSTGQMETFARLHLGEKQGEALLKQLGGRLREFGETPLLLWMLCGLFRREGEIPANLGLVFRKFVALYDTRVKQFDDVARSWQGRFLRELALRMMPQGGNPGLRLGVPRREAEDLLAEVLEIPVSEAIGRLDQLLRFHLLQLRGADDIEFKHQLFQEYFAAEGLLGLLPQLSDLEVQKHYLNLLDWSEALALVAGLLETEAEALRLVRLGLEVDLYWGARLAGEVLPQFQNGTVGLVLGYEVPEVLRVELLGQTRSQPAIPSLHKALNDSEPFVRGSAVRAISQFEYEIAWPALQEALNDPHPFVSQLASQIVSEIKLRESLSSIDFRKIREYYLGVRHSITSTIKVAIPTLRIIAKDYIKSSEAVLPHLLQALEHQDPSVRQAVASEIGELGLSEAMLLPLCKALEHPDPYVCQVIVQQISKIADQRALPALLKALDSEDSVVRRQAAKVIGQIGGEGALPALLKTLEDPDSDVRRQAVAAISQIGNEAALPTLWQHYLKTPRDYLQQAIQTLQNKNKIYNYDISQTPLPILMSSNNNYTFTGPINQLNIGPIATQNNSNIQNNINTNILPSNLKRTRLQTQIQDLHTEHQATFEAWRTAIDPSICIRLQRKLDQLEADITKLEKDLENLQISDNMQ